MIAHHLPAPARHTDRVSLLVCIAVVVFPATVLTAPRVANVVFSILAAAGLLLILRGAMTRNPLFSRILRTGWPIILSTAALPASVAFNQIVVYGQLPDIPYLYLRFTLFLPLTWILLLHGDRIRPFLESGLIIGALASGAWMLSLDLATRPGWIGESNVIPFANLSLLMGMLAFASLSSEKPTSVLVITAKTLAFMAGIYVSIASGTRGGWIAIPFVLLVIGYAARGQGQRALPRLLLLTSIVLAVVIAVTERLRNRVIDAVAGFVQPNPAGSEENAVTVRLELWRAAIEIFLLNPVAGVGPSRMESAIKELERNGYISSISANYTHAHHDMLHALATLGIPGLLAVAACTLVPAYFFAKRIRHPDRALSSAATMGLVACSGMLLFGLTEAMFVISLTNAFYSFMLSAFFAMIVVREQSL